MIEWLFLGLLIGQLLMRHKRIKNEFVYIFFKILVKDKILSPHIYIYS